MARELVGECALLAPLACVSPCNRGHPGADTIQVLPCARFRGDGEHSAARYGVGERGGETMSIYLPWFRSSRCKVPPKLYYRFGRWRVVAVSAWKVVRVILVRSLAPAGCSMAAPLKHLKQIGHFLETLSSRSLNFGSSAAINSPWWCGVRHSVLLCCTPTSEQALIHALPFTVWGSLSVHGSPIFNAPLQTIASNQRPRSGTCTAASCCSCTTHRPAVLGPSFADGHP